MNQKQETAELKHIMLTDNEALERELFSIIVADIRPVVKFTPADSGATLLQYLQQASVLPDIIFLDCDMPPKSGIETLTEIRHDTRLAAIPVVMYTSNTNESNIESAYNHGADFYFIKPIDIKQLKQIIEWLIDNIKTHTIHPRNKFVLAGKKRYL